jgi:hypothetical protein
MTERSRGVELRDLALLVVKARGTWEESQHGGPRMLVFDDHGLMIAYFEPSQILPNNMLLISRRWFLVPVSGNTKPKITQVLKVVWNEADVTVAAYKAGRWEEAIEKLAAEIAA